MKIVSLLSSATEILCALELEKQLMGRSHECDYPASTLNLPLCTETKFKTEGSSAEIDARIKEIVEQGLSVYRVLPERLQELQPDVIVTQIQCEVCAVSERDVHEALCHWLEYRPKIISLKPGKLEDIWQDIRAVAQGTGVAVKGENLVLQLKGRMDKIARQTASFVERPSVACIEWIEPLMSTGNWMPELIEIAGGRNLFGISGKHSPPMQWSDLVDKDPEIIVILPCGWGLERSRKEMHYLTQKPEWRSLRAVKNHTVFLADGNQYFNRSGPRIVDSLEILAELIHPKTFSFGYEGKAWQKFAI